MQMISEVMSRNVRFVAPQENLQHAAQLMDELNVGALPVCDGDRLVGMITDRDITVRATAAGIPPDDARVEEAMSGDVRWCFEDQSVDEVMQQMADTQIRRVPVVTHDDEHRLIGIVALGDLATRVGEGESAQAVQQVVEQVSSPSSPDLSSSGSGLATDDGLNAGGGGGSLEIGHDVPAGMEVATGDGTGGDIGAGAAAGEESGAGTETLSDDELEAVAKAATDPSIGGALDIDTPDVIVKQIAKDQEDAAGSAGTAGSGGPDAGARP